MHRRPQIVGTAALALCAYADLTAAEETPAETQYERPAGAVLFFWTRHGQTGSPDITDLGRTQARLLAGRLRKMGFNGVVYASPYKRTVATADVIAGELGTVVYLAPAIQEVLKHPEHMAKRTGPTIEDFRLKYTHIAPDATLPIPWWATQKEDRDIVFARVAPFLDELIKTADRDVLLVGHAATVGAMSRYFGKRAKRVGPRGTGGNWNCAFNAVQIEPAEKTILALNDTSHLAYDQTTKNKLTKADWERKQLEKSQE